MSPDDQQEAIKRAIQSIKNNADKQSMQGGSPNNLGQAPSPTPNPNLPNPILNALPSEPTPAPQTATEGIKNAVTAGKSRQQMEDDLINNARQ